MAVAVLMLEAFAGQRGAAGSAAEQEAADAHVGGGPDQVADALEAEHRVKNKKRNRVDAVRGVGGAGGDERRHRAGLGDAFFENLAVFGFLVVEQRVHVDRLVELADAGIDSHCAEERFHAEGASFVRDDGHDQFAEFRIAQQLPQDGDEGHGGGDFAAIAAGGKFLERLFQVRGDWFRADTTLRHVAAKLFAALTEIADFFAVFSGPVEGNFGALLVGYGNVEARAEFAEFVFVQLLLLVRDVAAFAGFAEAVAFDRVRQNYRRRAVVFDGGFVRGVNFSRIVAAEPQAAELLVGERLDQFQQLRARTEEMFADVCAGLDDQLLVFAVDHFAHALDEKAFGVALENRIPLAAPQDFDDVPSGAAERRFELLNDLAVAAHGTVEALQIAVDDEDQVVEFFAGGQGDGAERFRFVGFAVAEERPDFRICDRLKSAIFQVTIEARLIDGHDRAEAHRNGGEFPEIGHQPGMRIGGKAAAGLQFTAKIFELLFGEAAFQKCARIDSGRGVALKIDDVAFELRRARAEEMVEADFVQRGGRGVGGNVAADVVLFAIRAHDHGDRIPANEALDAPLEFLIAGEIRLQADGESC